MITLVINGAEHVFQLNNVFVDLLEVMLSVDRINGPNQIGNGFHWIVHFGILVSTIDLVDWTIQWFSLINVLQDFMVSLHQPIRKKELEFLIHLQIKVLQKSNQACTIKLSWILGPQFARQITQIALLVICPLSAWPLM